MGINSRIAIVTGAAKGIGRSIALTFAKKGIVPVIADINKNGADMVADEIRKTGVNSISYEADVSNVEQISKMVEDIDQMFGRVDILVNNAGILDTTSIEDMDENVWDRVMNINVKSVMFLSQKVLKYMKKQEWGRIINISSMAGRMGGIYTSCAYSASKAAIIGLTRCIAGKVAAYNITVNAVAPGTTESELLKGFTAEELDKLKNSIPVRKLGKPENIAETVAFLASEAAENITGAVIDINGGVFMG